MGMKRRRKGVVMDVVGYEGAVRVPADKDFRESLRLSTKEWREAGGPSILPGESRSVRMRFEKEEVRSVLLTVTGQIEIEAASEEDYIEKRDKFLSRLNEVASFVVESEDSVDGDWWDD